MSSKTDGKTRQFEAISASKVSTIPQIKYSITTVGGKKLVAARLFGFVGHSDATELTEIKGYAAGAELAEILRLKKQAFLDLRSLVHDSYHEAERAMLAISAIERESSLAYAERAAKTGEFAEKEEEKYAPCY